MDVDKIAFTGSTATGRKILQAAAQSNLKKVTLELGGKSPHLIFASADLDKAAEQAVLGIMYNMGQDCCGGQEIGSRLDVSEFPNDDHPLQGRESMRKPRYMMNL